MNRLFSPLLIFLAKYSLLFWNGLPLAFLVWHFFSKMKFGSPDIDRHSLTPTPKAWKRLSTFRGHGRLPTEADFQRQRARQVLHSGWSDACLCDAWCLQPYLDIVGLCINFAKLIYYKLNSQLLPAVSNIFINPDSWLRILDKSVFMM